MAPQREWFEKDYYATLGVSKESSAKEITKAYRKLARELHPDANPGDTSAEERFKEVSTAYDVLGEEGKRREYDQLRAMGPMGGFRSGVSGFGPGVGNFDLGDLLGGLFGGSQPNAGRGNDLETRLKLSFEEAIFGVTTSVSLVSDVACSTCSGVGTSPGSEPRTCNTCGGRGEQAENQGPFSFSRPCSSCRGSGYFIDDPCATCRGSGLERRSRSVKVRIPAGVEDGQRIRLKGRGGSSRGGPPGDLYVILSVAPHQDFGRKGSDLTFTVPLTYPEAVLGAEVSVPTLDDALITLKVPAGTRSGSVFRVKGRGVRARRGVGDLLVTVEIHVPAITTECERSALQALAEAMSANGGDTREGLAR